MSERIPTLRAILKCANHPSISAIKEYNRTCHQFFFPVVEKENIIKELQKLNLKKVTQKTDIQVKILKDSKYFFAGYFQMFFFISMFRSFSIIFKNGICESCFQEMDKKSLKKTTDFSVSCLWFRRFWREFLSKQLTTFFDNILLKYQCGFRPWYTTLSIANVVKMEEGFRQQSSILEYY